MQPASSGGTCWRVSHMLACVLLASGCGIPQAERGSEALLASSQSESGQTRVVLLGTGTPGAEPDRSGPATAIVVGERAYLIDAGPGIVRQASAAARAQGITQLVVPNLDIAFLTHLHSDHTAGYPDLILTPWVLGRRQPLQVYGPPGLQAMTESLLAAYQEDIRVRTSGPEQLPPEGGRVDVHEITEGPIFGDGTMVVEAFRVPHGIWEHAFGFKFTSPDRVVVVSGDTGPFDGLVDIARDADVLLHEAYMAAELSRLPRQNQRYHGTFHTSATKVGQIAAEAQVGMVILYHQLHFAGGSPEQMVEEVRAQYDGPVVYGRDLDVY